MRFYTHLHLPYNDHTAVRHTEQESRWLVPCQRPPVGVDWQLGKVISSIAHLRLCAQE